jgi:hypothetical protein
MFDPHAIGPFAESQTKALSFIMSLIVNAAVSETLKVMDDMQLEGKQLIKDIKASEGNKKEEARQALKLHIQDSKLLLETIMSNPIEKDA